MGLLKKILGPRKYEKFSRNLALATKTYIKTRRLSPWPSEDLRTVAILNHFGLNKVLDVGANVGQFADSLYDYGYEGTVVSFEPTSPSYEILKDKVSKNVHWKMAEKCAIGDHDGEVEMNVSNNTAFNSIKTIKKEYSSYNHDATIVDKQLVPIFKLDSLKDRYFNESEDLFLKIDTQGFEKEVLAGAENTLKFVKGIKIEVPLIAVYDNVDWDLANFVNFFESRNFKCISVAEVSVDRRTGVVYEVDMIFIKESLLSFKP